MKHLIMGTAGHVDHGKTSLIKALTHIDCDTHKEEKRRGITINLGFSYLPLTNGDMVGIVDVPGHKDFINTMVAGSCGIDFVLLVVAADSGIMPQTIEHIQVISLLGIKKAIVALTKTDLVDADLAELAKNEVQEYLLNTPFFDSPVIGVSSINGDGLDELKAEIEKICQSVQEKKVGDFFRMYVDRFFCVKGMGSVVTGSVLSGEVSAGTELTLLPNNFTGLKIKSIERHGNKVEKVKAGDRASLNIPDLKKEDIDHGVVLTNKPLECSVLIDVYVRLLKSKPKVWSTIIFLTGTYQCQAKMHVLGIDKESDNSFYFAQIYLPKPAALVTNDRFILRNTSGDSTEGGGFVMDVTPLHHRKITSGLIDKLSFLAKSLQRGSGLMDILSNELKKKMRPWSIKEVTEKFNENEKEIISLLENGIENLTVYNIKDEFIIIHKDAELSIKNRIIAKLEEYHTAHYLFADGLKTNELFGKTGLEESVLNKTYLELLLQSMMKDGLLRNISQTWIKHNHSPVVDEKTNNLINWLDNEILMYDVQKPVLADIENKFIELGASGALFKILISYLSKKKRVYFYNSEVIHMLIVNKFRELLLKELLANMDKGVDSEDFRKQHELSKRLLPLLLAIFEKEKIIQIQKSGYKSQLFITAEGERMVSNL